QGLLDNLEKVAREKEENAAAEEAKKQTEAKKQAEEKAAAEAKRLAEEKAAAEAERLRKAEEVRKQAEAKRQAEEKAVAEAKRLAEEKAAHENEEIGKAEEVRKQAEANKQAEEKAAAEGKRLAEEKAAAEAEQIGKAEEVRKQAEAKRLAEEKAAAEAKRLAEEKAAAETERLRKAEEARKQAEATRLAEANRAAAEAERVRRVEVAGNQANRLAEDNPAAGKPGIALPVTPPETRSSRKEQTAAMAPLPTVDQNGQTFQDCADCPVVVRIPAGSFAMGQAKGDASAAPQHTVTVRSFAIGQYPVVVGEWKACVAGGGCNFTPRMANADDRTPVHNISWDDAQQYILWLSRSTGENYRLPTEAEWEYAARAHTSTRYWWGDNVGTMLANCSDCGGSQNARTPLPVGSFKPNPFGLHDMHGGVAQWVADCWFPNYQGAPADARAREQKNCQKRVL